MPDINRIDATPGALGSTRNHVGNLGGLDATDRSFRTPRCRKVYLNERRIHPYTRPSLPYGCMLSRMGPKLIFSGSELDVGHKLHIDCDLQLLRLADLICQTNLENHGYVLNLVIKSVAICSRIEVSSDRFKKEACFYGYRTFAPDTALDLTGNTVAVQPFANITNIPKPCGPLYWDSLHCTVSWGPLLTQSSYVIHSILKGDH